MSVANSASVPQLSASQGHGLQAPVAVLTRCLLPAWPQLRGPAFFFSSVKERAATFETATATFETMNPEDDPMQEDETKQGFPELQVGMQLDALDSVQKWSEAEVVQVGSPRPCSFPRSCMRS